MKAPRFAGVVKSYNSEKGWGFFECDETHKLYGTDIFVMKQTLITGQEEHLLPGQPVTFDVVRGTKGMCAADVRFGTEGSYEGRVKSFNAQKGYGFITCPETDDKFGRDIFLQKHEAAGFNVEAGMRVTFDVYQGEKGPMAHNVAFIDEMIPGPPSYNPLPPAPAPKRIYEAPAAPQTYRRPERLPQAATVPPPQQYSLPTEKKWNDYNSYPNSSAHAAPQRQQHFSDYSAASNVVEIKNFDLLYYGRVTEIDNIQGTGRIVCEATSSLCGGDAIALRMAVEISGVKVDDAVRFTLANGPKGGIIAVNLGLVENSLLGSDGEGAPRVYTGYIKSYNDTKGYGFIVCKDAKVPFTGDVFLSKQELPPGVAVLKRDDRVFFTVDVTTGRAVAHNVQLDSEDQGFGEADEIREIKEE